MILLPLVINLENLVKDKRKLFSDKIGSISHELGSFILLFLLANYSRIIDLDIEVIDCSTGWVRAQCTICRNQFLERAN